MPTSNVISFSDCVRHQKNQTDFCSTCGVKEFCLPMGLDEAAKTKLDTLLKKNQRVVHKNDLLIQPGTPFDKLYVVRSGSLKTFHENAQGSEHIMSFNLPGEILGFDALRSEKHHLTVKALETSSVCEITFRALFLLAADSPPLQLRLLTLATQPQASLDYIHLNNSALERIALFLLNLSDRFNKRGLSPVSFHLSMTRQDIANYLGLTIETTSRMLSKLQKLNIIQLEQRDIALLDLRELQLLAAQRKKD
jgi:CRP/FNR family transcriptional regulator